MNGFRHIVRITFANGSSTDIECPNYTDAKLYCQDSISYSGGRVKRVVIVEPGACSERAMWDASWDPLSKHAGLYHDHD